MFVEFSYRSYLLRDPNRAGGTLLVTDGSEVSNPEEFLDSASAVSRRRFIAQVGLYGMITVLSPSVAFPGTFHVDGDTAPHEQQELPSDGTQQNLLEDDPTMPLAKIDAFEGRSDAEVKILLDATHRAIVASFGVPLRDRYQIYQAHRQAHVVFQDTGLNIARTERFVLFTIFSKQRAEPLKVKLYAELTRELQTSLAIAPSDVMVCLVENSGADWSFGNGIGQFLTGDLK